MINQTFDIEFIDNIYAPTPKDYTRYSARGVVINSQNQVAVLHIVGKDYFGNRNHYELPGGGIEKKEKSIEAFKREMEEEIGVVTKDEVMIAKIRYAYNILRRYDVSDIFIARVKEYCDFHFTDQEKGLIEKVVWMDIDALIEHFGSAKVENVGILIHARDLWILKKAKQILDI